MAGGKVARRWAWVFVLGLAEAAAGLAMTAVTTPANAQQFDDRFPFIEERVRRGGSDRGNNPFSNPSDRRGAEPSSTEYNAKAPPPKSRTDAAPLTSVVVLGDSMA